MSKKSFYIYLILTIKVCLKITKMFPKYVQFKNKVKAFILKTIQMTITH